MGRFYDFDAAWAEQAAKKDAPKPVQVKVLGRTWDLYAEVPAAAILLGARLMHGGDRALSDAEQVEYLSALVPEPVYQAWLDRGISVPKIGDLVHTLLGLYMAADPEPDPGGAEAQTVNHSSPPSSPDGPPSKLTSLATTAST